MRISTALRGRAVRKRGLVAAIADKCQKCGREISIIVGQSWRHGLRWSMSCRCPFCGAAYEADGRGIPPQDIRAAILSEQGQFELHVTDIAAPTICIAKLLRKELSLSIPQSSVLLRKMPGAVASGTRGEMEWLAHLVGEECGYSAAVVKRA